MNKNFDYIAFDADDTLLLMQMIHCGRMSCITDSLRIICVNF